MKWKRIPKERSIQPSSGSYQDWKQEIADEGFHQCVYCAIHDADFGGIRNFHVEHYKPKSIVRFKDLRDDITNLYYACPICNTFKSNDWPSDPVDDFSIHCYPDPSIIDYCDIFVLDEQSGLVSGRYIASKYMVEKLYLNRPQLVMERRIISLRIQEKILRGQVKELYGQLKGKVSHNDTLFALLERINLLKERLIELKDKLHEIPPYTIAETERKVAERKIRARRSRRR